MRGNKIQSMVGNIEKVLDAYTDIIVIPHDTFKQQCNLEMDDKICIGFDALNPIPIRIVCEQDFAPIVTKYHNQEPWQQRRGRPSYKTRRKR